MAVVRDAVRTSELRIVPEPAERDREAIARALARAPAPSREPGGRSAWWREGVRESLSALPR